MFFQLQHKDAHSEARKGIIRTSHGDIETPVFMPVGTLGNVKGITNNVLNRDSKASIILGNTYHLYLRPGTEVISRAGGMHKFISWNKPILADSGGFQVFSLTDIRKLKEDGVEFRSHIDGSKHFFTPEKVIDIQRIFGNNIMMPLDECTPYPCDYTYAAKSLQLTHKWLLQGLKHFKSTNAIWGHEQRLFPIVQGSVYKDLRKESAKFMSEQDVEGIAIGGLSVGEPAEMMYEILAEINPILPKTKPRYLMGVGTPVNLLEGISLGIDMFDCVMPTRNGRNGMLFTNEGIINIKNEKWKYDYSPLDENGTSFVDNEYSKAFVRHAFVANEMIAPIIASIHNIRFYINLMEQAREHIANATFNSWKNQMIPKLQNRL
jgi:queuine tRNA-ribosyltransferase